MLAYSFTWVWKVFKLIWLSACSSVLPSASVCWKSQLPPGCYVDLASSHLYLPLWYIHIYIHTFYITFTYVCIVPCACYAYIGRHIDYISSKMEARSFARLRSDRRHTLIVSLHSCASRHCFNFSRTVWNRKLHCPEAVNRIDNNFKRDVRCWFRTSQNGKTSTSAWAQISVRWVRRPNHFVIWTSKHSGHS